MENVLNSEELFFEWRGSCVPPPEPTNGVNVMNWLTCGPRAKPDLRVEGQDRLLVAAHEKEWGKISR